MMLFTLCQHRTGDACGMNFRMKNTILIAMICAGLAAGESAWAGEATGKGFPVRSSQTGGHASGTSAATPGITYGSGNFYAGANQAVSSRVQSYNPQNPHEVATLPPLNEASLVSTPLATDARSLESQPITFPDNPRRKRGSDERREFNMPSIWPALLSVMVVCGIFCLILYMVKKYLPGHRQLFSHPAMEVLGRTHLDQKRYVSLLRVGKRIVVVGVSPDEMRPLSEITDEEEITSIMEVARPKTESGLTVFQKLFKRTVVDAEAAETRALAKVQAEQLDEQMSSLRRRVREIGGAEKPQRRAKATVDTVG